MAGFTWVLSAIGQLFGIFNVQLLGVPVYAYFVLAFVFGLLAKFLHGRR